MTTKLLLPLLLAVPAAAQNRAARVIPSAQGMANTAPIPVLPPGAPLNGARLAPAPAPSLAPAPAPSVAHAPAAIAIAAQPAAAAPAAAAALRPAVEGWSVSGRDYASTRGLLRELPALKAPTPAVYRYAHGPAEPARRVANTAVAAVSGGAIGAFGGLIFFLLGSAVAPIFDLFLGGNGAGPALSEIYLFSGGFAAFGAFMGAVMGWEELGKPSSHLRTIGGTLYRHAAPGGERLYFETSHEGKRQVVDLTAYAHADELAPAPAPARWPAWKSALAGAAAGAALAVSQWVPLAQIITLPVFGPAAGYLLGKSLTAGTGIKGGLLGGSLGLFVPIAAFASFSAVPAVGLATAFFGFVGAFTALGLLLGPVAANAFRAQMSRDDAQNPKGQWWSNRPY